MPATIGLRKVTATVVCLCRLHNFLVDVRINARKGPSATRPEGRLVEGQLAEGDSEDIAPLLATEALEIQAGGAISLVRRAGQDSLPVQLMDGGHHHDDTTEAFRRQFSRRGGKVQPREKLKDVVKNGGNQRPVPKKWKTA